MQAWTETRYKIVRTIKAKKNASNKWELYDLLSDPFEENDLSEQHPEVVTRMDSNFSTWAKSVETDRQKVVEKYYPPRNKSGKNEKARKKD